MPSRQVELTEENLDEVVFKSGRSREDLKALLARKKGKESVQVYIFEPKEEKANG